MAKYTRVEKDRCIVCGACVAIAPDVYEYDDEGYAGVIFGGDDNRGVTAIDEEFLDDLLDAEDGCPTLAVKLSDTPFS
ncbi:ferredoxin [Cohnella thailandensis]|uniref:Ferredoxin n=1 Tax=Cohnella thailandensis TaxID=557557 RepID=A0A841SRH3_9BACL|nr:ferredoxin [Cohnella thailandensis]MBB6633509.1 ferredoxin [Cohnella thailandensis]MBP1974526.1 ferredoxin [Cohnella thailandensis]